MNFDRISKALGRVTVPQEAPVEPRMESAGATKPAHGRPAFGEPLLAVVERVSANWFGGEGRRPARSAPLQAGVPSAEELRAAAAASDILLTHDERNLSSLRDDEYPLLVLLIEGTGLLLTGRREGVFLFDDGSGKVKPI